MYIETIEGSARFEEYIKTIKSDKDWIDVVVVVVVVVVFLTL